MKQWWPQFLVACLLLGCSRSNMDSQPRYDSFEPGPLYGSGQTLQKPVSGTVPRHAKALAGQNDKPVLNASLMARGEERYNIFCSPCHDGIGSGEGMIVRRGMPRPPSLQVDRLRQADDQHLFDVVTNGYGAMYAFNDRIESNDRWAIVAFVRALQLSQNATRADLTDAQRGQIER